MDSLQLFSGAFWTAFINLEPHLLICALMFVDISINFFY